MHVNANLLNGVGNVWMCEGHVLQGTGEATVYSVGSETREPAVVASLDAVSMGDEEDVHELMSVRSKILTAYFC
jgi:hypothetical protein